MREVEPQTGVDNVNECYFLASFGPYFNTTDADEGVRCIYRIRGSSKALYDVCTHANKQALMPTCMSTIFLFAWAHILAQLGR